MPPSTHADIATRAYHIWEQEGRPHGRDFDHWLRAEQELAARRAPARTAASTQRTAKRSPQRRASKKPRKA